MRKKAIAEDFHTSTRAQLMKRLQDIDDQKEQENQDQIQKIKKLLQDTIDVSQKMALAQKRKAEAAAEKMEAKEGESAEGGAIIRNLIGASSEKGGKGGHSPDHKAGFLSVVEHQDEEESEEDEDDDTFIHTESVEAQRIMQNIKLARKRVFKKSVQLQKQIKEQEAMR